MIILPAIDIKDGNCVRLFKGDFNTVEKVADDYLTTAKSFEQAIAYGENSSRLRINNYKYSIKRLAVVYRKLKRYDEEVRVIRIGLAHEDMDQKSYKELESRLEKVLSLKQK
jgi:hypothetical protein